MWRMVQYPRYNVVSVRLSETEMRLLKEFVEYRKSSRQEVVHHALMEWIKSIIPQGGNENE